ncbi:cation-translocating P-type ATPase [Aristaeella hokkaidonensis]|uniref:Cation-translocating P-type ATPase n=1 Tax=Aristaeella hokkaidonensis TaxID=3046382 RepID=A0AC61MUP0_9FIRM|nr:cation-translocating P-type ATPase [Aristaeella hokkaidonensis]QTE70595.1 cation-translocating P-type ATPase [Clostridiales bacterium FE2011]QTE74563.1 cation-translocating P-type ATPase [Clostridiales bacterium FE2010]QUC65827.1 cation-translocating P-type ATPase [Aristaeella hokkaidonensis]SNT93961.1 Ca2+-transporting ATPase [Aristaeella hokkaidonensis]
MKPYLEEKEAVLAEAGSSMEGLSDEEAAVRLVRDGHNKLKEGEKESLIRKFLGELKDPMTIVLIIAAVVSAITALYAGESLTDTIIILAVVLINACLGVYQESKAEAAIEALQQVAAATAKVIRGGHLKTIHADEVVRGDMLILEAGDAVPADARIVECASMKTQEAALTGESTDVEKQSEALAAAENGEVSLGDRKNMVYMGSIVTYGRGHAVVTGTGMDTEMGAIADALTNAKDEETPLQIKLKELSRKLSAMILVICAFVFIVNLVRNGGKAVLDTFMIAVSLAVAAIPEGLSAVVTVLLSIGVTKMSKNHAIIRKLTAVETLGCTQIICSDKTGTLTQNKMTVVRKVTDDEKLLMSAMALCSDAELEEGEAVGEATECALVNDANRNGMPKEELAADLPRVDEAPFDSLRKMMTTLHRMGAGHGFIQFTKGAPDEVLRRCTKIWQGGQAVPITKEQREQILAENKGMADQALRVLGAAQRIYDERPASNAAEDLEQDLTWIGMCGMIDPIRPEVKDAIQKCRSAGIRPIMITGDHKDTATAIARELGILQPGQMAITGAELDAIPDEVFAHDVRRYSVYARVQPENKVRIVNAWKALGMVTAMTGDGVNDAPSIKSADIGVGMGITGTDVTKSVADMILTDDNFATIVSAVGEGRRIYDNIRKAIQFLLSANLAEVLAVFSATLMGFTILKPVHILWINLITDTLPAIALGMEDAEKDVMQRPPRHRKESIFADGLGFGIAFQGLIIAAVTVFSYFIGHRMESGAWGIAESPAGMTMAFLTLSMVEIFHSFNMRSRHASLFSLKKQNMWLWGTLAFSLLITAAVIFVPFLNKAFSFTPITLAEYLTAMALALVVIPIVEIEKAIRRWTMRKNRK